MIARQFKIWAPAVVVLFAMVHPRPGMTVDADDSRPRRPNVVWIMSEDNSKHYLQHFDPGGVSTPAIEAMAASGVTFDRAFSNAPVCSVARSTLITGCVAPRLGLQYHRPIEMVRLSGNAEMFPALLRDAGYYTSNQSKQDYNANWNAPPWDDSGKRASWENRPTPQTSFFHVETHTDSHESRMHFSAAEMAQSPTRTSPADVPLPAYLPETDVFRYAAARYRDRMRVIDDRVAKTIDQLERAGVLEDTFVFYFGDHGGVLPRSKGFIYESGLHVPLVVRVPENFRDFVNRPAGSRTRGFVSFVDFAPTVLNLAGVPVPEWMDGRAFLGADVDDAEVDSRDTTFGHVDRCDEKIDLVRSVRVGDWKYIRSFEPWHPDSLLNEYRSKMLAQQEWQTLFDEGQLDEVRSQFFRPRRPEMLFDLSADPDEVENLADEAQHASKRNELREILTSQLKSTNDLSFLPEAIFLEEAKSNPVRYGIANAETLHGYIDIANLAVGSVDESIAECFQVMNAGDPWARYWALVAVGGLTTRPAARVKMQTDEAMLKLLRRRTVDLEPLVAARAAEVLFELTGEDPRPTLVRSINRSVSPAEALAVMNALAAHQAVSASPDKTPIDPIGFLFTVPRGSVLLNRLKNFSAD